MRRFALKLLNRFNDLRFQVPSFRCQTGTIDENAEEIRDHRGAVTRISDGKGRVKPSARQRLDGLSNLRIHPTAIEFTSNSSHKSGGKASVARATCRRVDGGEQQAVAVKKLRYHQDMKRKKFENAFVHEVEVMVGLSHENIVRLVGFVEDLKNGTAWIVLSWEPNGNVGEFLAGGDWEIPERVSLIKDTLEGIKYLHTRQPPICHGDLKSLNILVSSSYRAVITDFGSARAISAPEDQAIGDESGQQVQVIPTRERTGPPIHVGAAGNQLTLTGPAWSLRWAAPEVMNGNHPSFSSDIWAAGWVCWELMTGKVPFPELNWAGGITLTVIRGKVPPPREDGQLAQIVALCSLMTDCWAFSPKARPDIIRCCTELQWMPATVPTGGNPSGSKGPSVDLVLKKGQMHYTQGDHEKASLLFEQALSLARSAENRRTTAEALFWLGNIYRGQCKYTQAQESFTQAEETYGGIDDDQGRANALDGLGEIYHAQSKYTQAEESFTRAQEIHTRIGDDLGRANGLRGLGEVYRAKYKYTQAEESFTRAQDIYGRIGDDLGIANALDGLGEVYRAQARYTLAEESFTREKEIHARIGNDQGQANALQGLGGVYRAQAMYPQAEKAFTQAQETSARMGDDLGWANALQGLGEVYLAQSKYTQAKESFTQSQETSARIGDDQGQANAFQGLGDVCRLQSKYTQAEELYTQAQEIHVRIGDALGRATALRGLGEVYLAQSKHTQAEESLTRAQEVYAHIGDDLGRANTLRSVGHLRRSQGRNVEAAAHYTDARDRYAQIGRTEDAQDASHWLAVVLQLQDRNSSRTSLQSPVRPRTPSLSLS